MKVNQPTLKPVRKVNSAGLGAILATILVAALTATNVPFLTQMFSYPGVETAIGGLLATGFAYFAKEAA